MNNRVRITIDPNGVADVALVRSDKMNALDFAMFDALSAAITRLKGEGTNARFLSLFETHNELDHQIKALEGHDAGGTHVEIETLKKEKLHIKDELYDILRAEASASK